MSGRPHLRVDEEAFLGLKVQPVGEPTIKPIGLNPRSVERVNCPTSQPRSLPDDWAGALRGILEGATGHCCSGKDGGSCASPLVSKHSVLLPG
jgi:hypothetical protein